MTVRVGVNGFGRIGGTLAGGRLLAPTCDIVAVNDLTDTRPWPTC